MRRHAVSRVEPQAPAERDGFPLTETGDSEFFAECYRGRLRYDHTRRMWFTFGPHHWVQDITGSATQRAVEAMRRRQAAALQVADMNERALRAKWAIAGESESRLRHLLELASTNPALAVEGDQWDADPMLLGVENGVVDLRTGTLRDGTPDDDVTLVAPVPFDAGAMCERWEQFVIEIAGGDAELAAYLGRMLGYCLTGLTGEQVFFLLHGTGANGKSTFLETLTRHVLPMHSWAMPFPSAGWTDAMTEYQRASLVGRRLVVAKEMEAEKRLNTEFVKSLTGTDTVNARHPYGRPFTFEPQAKIVLACNHLPVIRDSSHGMWRRVQLVPFTQTFSVNPALPDHLAADAPGILRWLVAQCREWQRLGLGQPTAVRDATAQYREDSDSLAAFLSDRCVVADHAQVRAGVLFDAYTAWCAGQHVADADRLNKRTFGESVKARFRHVTGTHVTYVGVGLREERT